MSAASNGRAREHRVRDQLVAQGWVFILRSAGSKGAIDLLFGGRYPRMPLAVQVGTAASKRLGPADRARFLNAAEAINARPIVALTAPGKATTYLEVTDGPPKTWPVFNPNN